MSHDTFRASSRSPDKEFRSGSPLPFGRRHAGHTPGSTWRESAWATGSGHHSTREGVGHAEAGLYLMALEDVPPTPGARATVQCGPPGHETPQDPGDALGPWRAPRLATPRMPRVCGSSRSVARKKAQSPCPDGGGDAHDNTYGCHGCVAPRHNPNRLSGGGESGHRVGVVRQ